jgi:hypothetical protein
VGSEKQKDCSSDHYGQKVRFYLQNNQSMHEVLSSNPSITKNKKPKKKKRQNRKKTIETQSI